MKENLHLRIYNRFKPYAKTTDWFMSIKLPFMGGVPLSWVLVFFWRGINRESISMKASGIAFNLFLSLLPALLFLFTLIPYIPVHEMHTQVMEFMQTLMPSNAFITIQGTLQDILETPRGSLLSFGLILALYFGSNGIFAMTETFNPNDKHNYFYRRFMGIVLALVLGTLFIVDITVLLLGETGIKYILDFLNLNGQIADWAILLLRWGMMLLLIFVAYAILYYYGDPLREKWKYIYPGAFLATLFTLLTSFGYGYYVGRWGNYNKLYGSIGALIITMLWMYFNSIVVICGHEFNQSLKSTRKHVDLNMD